MLTNIDSLAKWIAGHRPSAVRLTAVLADGTEQALAQPAGAHKWKKVAQLAWNMHAIEVRLYDAAGALIGCERCGEDDDDAPEQQTPFTIAPAPQSVNAADLASVAAALATSFVQVVRDTMSSQAEVHKEAFKQLSDVAKIANTAAKEANEAAREAKEQLEAYIARRESELDDRETELEEKSGTADMLKSLASNPDALGFVRQLMAGKTNGTPPVPNGSKQ